MLNENDSHDTPTLYILRQMIYIRDITENHHTGVKMKVTIESMEVAEVIAVEVKQATGKDCEARPTPVGSEVIYDLHTVIARITPLSDVIDVEPLGGAFNGEITEIRKEARTLSGVRDISSAMSQATLHALSAATHH